MESIGIIGLGKMGLLHAGILNALPDCKVVSICEKEGMITRFAKKLLPNLRFYSTIGNMLSKEDELDAIYVTTPISTHLPIVQEIASSGRKPGVFVEKPLAGNFQDAKKMVDLSKDAGLKSMVGFQKRFSPIFQRGKKLINDGVLSELTSFSAYSFVSGVFSEGKGWRFKAGQGGALLDLGPHLIDLLLWYFGEPNSVEGGTLSFYSREVDDFANGRFEFGSGLEGTFGVSWCVIGYRLPEIGIDISGKNGKIKVTDDYLKVELYSDMSGMKAGNYHFRKPEFNSGVDFLIADPEYCIQDKHFIDCLLQNKMPEPDFDAGTKVNETIEKISHGSMKMIEVAEV